MDLFFWPYTLPRDLYEPKFTWRQNLVTCFVTFHLFSQVFVELSPVVGVRHVYKVHNDDSAHIAKAQLPGNLCSGHFVDMQRMVFIGGG